MRRHEPTFTVIDRATKELRDTGLTTDEVLDQHVEKGFKSVTLSHMRTMVVGGEFTLGDIIVRRVPSD